MEPSGSIEDEEFTPTAHPTLHSGDNLTSVTLAESVNIPSAEIAQEDHPASTRRSLRKRSGSGSIPSSDSKRLRQNNEQSGQTRHDQSDSQVSGIFNDLFCVHLVSAISTYNKVMQMLSI